MNKNLHLCSIAEMTEDKFRQLSDEETHSTLYDIANSDFVKQHNDKLIDALGPGVWMMYGANQEYLKKQLPSQVSYVPTDTLGTYMINPKYEQRIKEIQMSKKAYKDIFVCIHYNIDISEGSGQKTSCNGYTRKSE